MSVEITIGRDPEMEKLMRELGFDLNDDNKAWLRLHQILKSHEDRIKALEAKE